MAKHEVQYNADGLSLTDPWSLREYLQEDDFTPREVDLIRESVQSWLKEYVTAGCDIYEALQELG